MNLIEAVSRAIETDGTIAREMWQKERLQWGIVPTNSLPCFIVKGSEIHGHWNPCVEDVLASDWIILER